MKKLYIPLSAALISLNAMAQQTFTNFMNASLVIGQANFTTNNSTLNQSTNYGTTSSVISSQGKLAIGSQSAQRILIWNQVPAVNGAPADIVIGQPNFTSTNFGCTQSQMSFVEGVAFTPDGTKMVAADAGNNRILIWNTVPTSNFQPADVVIGQTNFTTSTSGVAADKLEYPSGLIITPDGKLIVSDMYNNRVLIYNSIPTTNGASADVVIGQTTFTTMSSGSGANGLNLPWYLTISQDGKLLIADHENNRVLVFNTVPTTNGASANVVIGQPDFTTISSGTSQNKFSYPIGVTAAPDGKIAIAEYSNNRVVIYNSIPTVNGANADIVLGQPNFTSNTPFNGGVSAQSMQSPYGIWFDVNSRLFVNGRDMNRVMVFGTLPVDSADVGINLTSNASSFCQNGSVSYTVTVNNNGPNTATNVVVNCALPNQFSLTASNASSGSYTAASGWWNIPSVATGSSAVLVLNGIVTSTLSQTLTAFANITNVGQIDGNLSNNGIGSTVVISNEVAPSNVTISGPNTVCSNKSYSFAIATASNATNFSWSANGSASVTGSGTLVTVLFSNNNATVSVVPSNSACTSSEVVLSVTVNPSPVIGVSTSSAVICAGSSAVLTATGATTYTWNTSATTPTINVSPSSTTNYTVTGTGANGCESSASITQQVTVCSGIDEYTQNNNLLIYPNPSNGIIHVKSDEIITSYHVMDITGKTVITNKALNSSETTLNLNELDNSVYFIKIQFVSGESKQVKLVIQK
jgi:hypothetical protein